MLAVVPLVSALVLLEGCYALGGLRYIHPPTAHGLAPRTQLESFDNAANWSNTTTAQNSAIVPVVLADDGQTYYSVIEVGQANFRVALDTGSADSFVISSGCSSSACSVPQYSLAYKSPTFLSVNNNQTVFNVSYADGTSASGFVGMETYKVGNLSVPAQMFGVVNQSTVAFTDEVSGILALGFPRLSRISQSVVNATPFFATMAQRGQLDYPLFGLSLTHNSSGSLTLGAVDGSVVQNISEIQWSEVIPFSPLGSESNTSSYLQWAIPLTGISVNSTKLAPLPTYANITNMSLALIDVGTPGIFGPFQDVSRIFSAIPGSRIVNADLGQWAMPCDASDTLSFQFNGHDFVMQPTDYLIGPTTGNPDICLSWPRALPPSSDGIDWQFGSAFLRTVYSIFSYGIDMKEAPLIGFYPLRNSTAPVQPPSEVAAFFSTASSTVTTDLPNFIVSTPSPSASSYLFNASVKATPGEIVSSGLATSTYSAALRSLRPNGTAIRTVAPSPTAVTFILTSDGHLVTSVSTAVSPTLGSIPGWSNSATALSLPLGTVLLSGLASVLIFIGRLAL